ncbi:MAG: PA14 domain-containing protein [Anaerolineae bacterium]
MFGRIAPIVRILAVLALLIVPLSPVAASAQTPATPWYAEYYGNTSLAGPPLVARFEAAISYDWGTGAPAPGVPVDNFSVRWTGTISFAAGDYIFTTVTDDGVRLFVDNALVIDRWSSMSRTSFDASVSLTQGNHVIRMEYFDSGVSAFAQLYWQQTVIARGGNILTCLAPAPLNSWIKVYRMESGKWVDINPHGWGRIDASGFLKIDGIPVDTGVYGGSGEPYLVQVWVNGSLVHEVGDTARGEPAFRVYAGHDNGTPWACPVS